MGRRITVTLSDYNRLLALLEAAMLKPNAPEVVTRLYDNLVNATIVSQNDISNNIVTMNSRISLKDVTSNRRNELVLTYPKDAQPHQRKISVLSDIGIAIFGRCEHDIVSWRVPSGIGTFEVVKVTYQPEAAGHFYL